MRTVQEVDRYNKLLGRIKKTLVDLQKGVKGLVVITTELYVPASFARRGVSSAHHVPLACCGHPPPSLQ